jgi:hypothetical protein
VKASRSRKKTELPEPPQPLPEQEPNIAKDAAPQATGTPWGYRDSTAEEDISRVLLDIKYGWQRIADIAKRQSRLTGV